MYYMVTNMEVFFGLPGLVLRKKTTGTMSFMSNFTNFYALFIQVFGRSTYEKSIVQSAPIATLGSFTTAQAALLPSAA